MQNIYFDCWPERTEKLYSFCLLSLEVELDIMKNWFKDIPSSEIFKKKGLMCVWCDTSKAPRYAANPRSYFPLLCTCFGHLLCSGREMKTGPGPTPWAKHFHSRISELNSISFGIDPGVKERSVRAQLHSVFPHFLLCESSGLLFNYLSSKPLSHGFCFLQTKCFSHCL